MRTPALMEKFACKVRAFFAAQRGNVAVTFTLALLPVAAAVGSAVDYSRANSIKAAMQAALDGTALMLVKSAETVTANQLSDQATAYFQSLFNRPEAQSVQINAQLRKDGGYWV